MQTYKKILFLLNIYGRKKVSLIIVLILIMAFLDMLGVAFVWPLVVVLTNPDYIETNSILNYVFKASSIFGVENINQFLIALSIIFYLLVVFSLSFRALVVYAQVRFIEMFQYNISKKLFEGYLYQPYSWFLDRHSADLGKNILSEVNQVTGGAIRPLIDLTAKITVSIALITLLVIANPKLALIVCFLFGSFYGIFYYFIREFLKRIGKESFRNNELRFVTINEAFGATKEVKVGRLEKTFIKIFSNSAKIFAQNQSSSQVISQLPRFVLEAIVLGGVMTMIFYLTAQTGNFNNALPTLSLYVFAGYRLMPNLQQIYSSFTSLTFATSSINRLCEDLKNIKQSNLNEEKDALYFNKEITLKNIFYNYPNASRTALKNISLNIPVNSIVGLVGPTGSGKTTVVDIILGLLEPQKGDLEVDGQIITKQNTRSWQRLIGYVPQQIFLSDDTIAANIAFGLELKDISQKALEKVAKVANLHEFILEELPNQYQTKIGERGVRLSGGQRQRIGIARALYRNPKVLILDEATSALDNQTEQTVMDAINNLTKHVTIILIAHRLSTVKKCDQIFLLENGELKHQGTFKELINVNENFRKSANV